MLLTLAAYLLLFSSCKKEAVVPQPTKGPQIGAVQKDLSQVKPVTIYIKSN